MLLRKIAAILGAGLLAVSAVHATPHVGASGDTVLIPFYPPIDESVRYRWELTDEKGGETRMRWSVDSYRFEEAGDGYRLTVEPISDGSNETDPTRLAFSKKIEELTKLPFVLRLDEDARIVELERGDEYWTKIIEALREALGGIESERSGLDKTVASIVGLFENMPPEARLAKLTEPIQPLVEFAWTETTVGKPVILTTETVSPFGPVNQEVAITLTRVADGFAHATIRSSIPAAELKKLTAAFFDKLNNGALKPEEVAKVKAALAAANDFSHETVAEYKVSIEDGMLESYHSVQTVTLTEADKPERRVKTLSVKRLD